LSVRVKLPAEPDKQPSIIISVALLAVCEEVELPACVASCATTHAAESKIAATREKIFFIDHLLS
jgi:hypothetical protein